MQLIGVIVITSKPEVVLSVKPYLELGPPAGDADPLSDVELFLLDYHWGLNVLLGDPDFVKTVSNVVYQVVLLTVDLDASASRLTPWFNNPGIFCAIEPKLIRPDRVL